MGDGEELTISSVYGKFIKYLPMEVEYNRRPPFSFTQPSLRQFRLTQPLFSPISSVLPALLSNYLSPYNVGRQGIALLFVYNTHSILLKVTTSTRGLFSHAFGLLTPYKLIHKI